MRTIEVKSCGECPFNVNGIFFAEETTITSTYLLTDRVHENCPLKTESVTVKLKEDE